MWLTLIGGIIFYILEKHDSFVRFYAMQSIIFGCAWFLFNIVSAVVHAVFGAIPGIGGILVFFWAIVAALVVAANQVIFSGGRVPGQISSASFQRDGSYYAFRNAVDQVVATVRQQFYLVLLDRALIGVQEESVRLLQSQLQDQQNRFEAGTVPRFNVLQAQVALSNQLPQLITARNNYTISQLQLAKTLGLDFDPRRGDSPDGLLPSIA